MSLLISMYSCIDIVNENKSYSMFFADTYPGLQFFGLIGSHIHAFFRPYTLIHYEFRIKNFTLFVNFSAKDVSILTSTASFKKAQMLYTWTISNFCSWALGASHTRSFSKAGFSQEAVSQPSFGLFYCFWTISIGKYGRPFFLVLLNHTSKKKVDKSNPQKR